MEKIYKKDFINALCNNESVLICSALLDEENALERVLPNLENLKIHTSDSRKVVKRFSNSLVFSNNSRLYDRDIGACYSYCGYVLSRKKIIYHQYARRDEVKYLYLIYKIL